MKVNALCTAAASIAALLVACGSSDSGNAQETGGTAGASSGRDGIGGASSTFTGSTTGSTAGNSTGGSSAATGGVEPSGPGASGISSGLIVPDLSEADAMKLCRWYGGLLGYPVATDDELWPVTTYCPEFSRDSAVQTWNTVGSCAIGVTGSTGTPCLSYTVARFEACAESLKPTLCSLFNNDSCKDFVECFESGGGIYTVPPPAATGTCQGTATACSDITCWDADCHCSPGCTVGADPTAQWGYSCKGPAVPDCGAHSDGKECLDYVGCEWN